MAVITKDLQKTYVKELLDRFAVLNDLLKGRPLKSAKEGCLSRKHWANPDMMCHIDEIKLRLAVGDFKTILGEINKIK